MSPGFFLRAPITTSIWIWVRAKTTPTRPTQPTWAGCTREPQIEDRNRSHGASHIIVTFQYRSVNIGSA